MTVAQALKEKNRLAAQLKKLWGRLNQWNSIIDGNTRLYEPRDLLTEIEETKIKLIAIKTGIHMASQTVRNKIFELSELKSHLNYLNTLNVKSGRIYDYGEYQYRSAVVTELEKDNMQNEIEKRIEQIQAELDQFNHTTKID
jgi:hypothetical protein